MSFDFSSITKVVKSSLPAADASSWYGAVVLLSLILLAGSVTESYSDLEADAIRPNLLQRPCDEIYVVGEGETLHTIRDKCGDPFIVEKNPHIHNLDDVFPAGARDGDDNLRKWIPDEDLLNFPESNNGPYTSVVVAKDGSGKYLTIKEGLDATRTVPGRVVIHIKAGEYKEYLEIGQDRRNLFLVGDGIGKTIITGDRSPKSGFGTFDSPAVQVNGDTIVFRDITIRNTAGKEAGQAVALIVSSDHSAFYRCSFEGYQDTLCVNLNKQFYRECEIYGSVDFIFGTATVVIQNSTIYARAPPKGGAIVVTAHGRDRLDETGISIINSRFVPDPSQEADVRMFKAFLGRPWRPYSRVVFMQTYLDGIVDPAGWGDMNSASEDKTHLFYGEYQNYGPGSSTSRRVKWKGFKVITDVGEAMMFTVANFLGEGLRWLPKTGVPFAAGLGL